MCATCGCGTDARATVLNLQTGKDVLVRHDHEDGYQGAGQHHGPSEAGRHAHASRHHTHARNAADHHGAHVQADGTRHSHAHGRPKTGVAVDLEARILAKNDDLAASNRAWFASRQILALNLVSAPGSGKTTLLERTIRDLRDEFPLRVLEGDQATANDGRRIRAAGAPVVQINTGTGCHLEADVVACGLRELDPGDGSVVLIENVGNLVCPALFDLGERSKVAILSVTEGDDKPLKYPNIFQAADVMIVNKVDLLPHVDFDVAQSVAHARAINPAITIFCLSARTGEGLESWYGWLREEVAAAREAAPRP